MSSGVTTGPHTRANIAGLNGGNVNALFETFMRRMQSKQSRPESEFNSIFFQHGTTSAKEPIFYYIARNYKGPGQGGADYDELVYYCLKTLQPVFNNPWVLIVDCTLFSPENQIPLSMCTVVSKVFPEVASNALHKVVFVNPNSMFKKYAQKTLLKVLSSSTQKKFFFSNAKELAEKCGVAAKDLKLPDYTLSVERDVKATFAPVLKLTSQYAKKEVCLR